MVFTGPPERSKKRLRTYVFALISNVGLSVLGGGGALRLAKLLRPDRIKMGNWCFRPAIVFVDTQRMVSVPVHFTFPSIDVQSPRPEEASLVKISHG